MISSRSNREFAIAESRFWSLQPLRLALFLAHLAAGSFASARTAAPLSAANPLSTGGHSSSISEQDGSLDGNVSLFLVRPRLADNRSFYYQFRNKHGRVIPGPRFYLRDATTVWSPDSAYLAISGVTDRYVARVQIFRVTQTTYIELPFDLYAHFAPAQREAQFQASEIRDLSWLDARNFSFHLAASYAVRSDPARANAKSMATERYVLSEANITAACIKGKKGREVSNIRQTAYSAVDQ